MGISTGTLRLSPLHLYGSPGNAEDATEYGTIENDRKKKR
jgi:hypothetical protein